MSEADWNVLCNPGIDNFHGVAVSYSPLMSSFICTFVVIIIVCGAGNLCKTMTRHTHIHTHTGTSLRGSLQFLMRHLNSKVINHQGWNE